MHLVEIFLPLQDRDKRLFPSHLYVQLAKELTERFGGVTSFSRQPAEGRWKQDGQTDTDDIIIMEVMTETLNHAWWSALRARLERDFGQDEILIRSSDVSRL